ncbi:MAG: DsbA family protein [Halioglobus sp.]
MSEDSTHIVVDYYSDVLCVWAWIAQARLDELEKQWGTKLNVRHHFVDIFGDSYTKIPTQWGQSDGFQKFGKHVVDSAQPFEMATINPNVWTKTRPKSSATSHLLLRAVALTETEDKVASTALAIRRAFFCDALDIGNMDLLLTVAQEQGLNRESLQRSLSDGSAMAALSTDQRKATELGVRGSPTWILNNGRQVLYGNVGYRILNANIEELLSQPGEEASWC